MIVRIYGLHAQNRPDAIRYVGKTELALQTRLSLHISSPHSGLITWIEHLRQKPRILLLQECDALSWEETERYWIVRLRKEGHPLLNRSRGGARGPLGFVRTVETRRRMSKAKIGSKNPMYGKDFSPKHRKRLSEVTGRYSRSVKGRRVRRQAIQKRWKDNPDFRHSKETCRKISESRRGTPAGPYTKERTGKMVKSLKKYYSDPKNKVAHSIRMCTWWRERKKVSAR